MKKKNNLFELLDTNGMNINNNSNKQRLQLIIYIAKVSGIKRVKKNYGKARNIDVFNNFF